MRKLSNRTLGYLLGVYTEMRHTPCGEFNDDEEAYEFDCFPNFCSDKNKENMQKIREFAKSLKWDYKWEEEAI